MNTLGLGFSLYWITTLIAFVMLTAILYLLVKGRRDLPVVKEEPHDVHLKKIAEYQRKGLRKYVVVEKCDVSSSPLSGGKLYIEFTFYVTNYSMFYISIPAPVDAVIEGSILFRGDLLSGVAKLVENKVKEVGPCGTYYFTVRQWVSASEAADISETLKTTGNLFDFSKAIVHVRGGDRFPDVDMAQLDLARGMQNVEFENKVIQLEALKSQYESEIELRQQRADAVEALTLVLGMAYSIYELYRHGEQAPKDQLMYLDACINGALHKCFDNKTVNDYYSNELSIGKIPDAREKQEGWVDAHCFRLRKFIAHRKEQSH